MKLKKISAIVMALSTVAAVATLAMAPPIINFFGCITIMMAGTMLALELS